MSQSSHISLRQTLKNDYIFFESYRAGRGLDYEIDLKVRKINLFKYFILNRSGFFLLLLRLASKNRYPRFRRYAFAIINIFYACDLGNKVTYPQKLYFPHPFGIVIGKRVQLDDGLVLFNDVTIGKLRPGRKEGMPILGSYVLVGVGARILGSITIGSRVIVGANSVVTKGVSDGHTVVSYNKIIPSNYFGGP